MDRKTQLLVEHAIDKFRPLLLMIGFPCSFCCIFNENLNYSQRMEVLEELRGSQRPLIRWLSGLIAEQTKYTAATSCWKIVNAADFGMKRRFASCRIYHR